jgi:hypothetical protein
MRKLLNKILIKFGLVIIPIKPPEGLLSSMAMREDHLFLAPVLGSDEDILKGRFSENLAIQLLANKMLTSEEKASRLVVMKQLHEEVVGTGFYKYE